MLLQKLVGVLLLGRKHESGGLTVTSVGEIQYYSFYKMSVSGVVVTSEFKGSELLLCWMYCGTCSRYSVSSAITDKRSGAANFARKVF